MGTTHGAAACPAQMNHVIADAWVGAAAAAIMRRTRSRSLITTGNWSKALSREDQVDDTRAGPVITAWHRKLEQEPVQLTERLTIDMSNPLRDISPEKHHALSDDNACVCALVSMGMP